MSPTPAQLQQAGLVLLPDNALTTHDNGWALHVWDAVNGTFKTQAWNSTLPLGTPLYAVPGWASPRPSVSPRLPASVPVGALLLNQDFSNQTKLDTTVWAPYWFSPMGQVNDVASDPANVSIVNGQLQLTLSSATDGACVSSNPATAKPGFMWLYGYAEASITFPGNDSSLDNWCAFWTMLQDYQNGEEFDIAEAIGGAMATNYHNRTNGVDTSSGSPNIPGNWGGTKHVYGMHWQPGLQDVYFDGVKVFSRTVRNPGTLSYLILNQGNGYGGPLVVGAKMLVDYVRVWALA